MNIAFLAKNAPLAPKCRYNEGWAVAQYNGWSAYLFWFTLSANFCIFVWFLC